MSGGSFNYVCYKLNDEADQVIQALPELREMETWLRSRNKHEAADEILRGIMRIETAQRHLEVIGNHLHKLTRAAEWWCSCDWGEDDFDETWKSYLGEK